jgi:Ca-activated chloride channel family protein
VTYLAPLPVDGALAGYAIRVGDRRIVGEVDRIETARERFETALIDGRAAGWRVAAIATARISSAGTAIGEVGRGRQHCGQVGHPRKH